MPLKKGSSQKVISANICMEIKAGITAAREAFSASLSVVEEPA